MAKILLFGSSGSGKSTFADMLSSAWGLPLLHMDVISYDEHWNRLSSEIIEPLVKDFMQQDSWIIDGHYQKFLYQERLEAADFIIFFDISRWTALWRCVRRSRRAHTGREKAKGAIEKAAGSMRWRFVHYILWRYPHQVRSKSIRRLQKEYPEKLILLSGKKTHSRLYAARADTAPC